jgi:hypothetical protein
MLSIILPLLASPVQAQNFQTWCGKQYEVGAPRTPPSPKSRFSYPSSGDQKLLDFKCSTASSIYLPGDDTLDPPAIVFDAAVAYDYGQPGMFNRSERGIFADVPFSLWQRGRVLDCLGVSRQLDQCAQRCSSSPRSIWSFGQLHPVRPRSFAVDQSGLDHLYRSTWQHLLYRYYRADVSTREPI